MEFDDRALPLTRQQLAIRLAQETGRSGTEWPLSLSARIVGAVERDALTLHRPIGVGAITTSNSQHFDHAADGRRHAGSIRLPQQAIRIKRALTEPPDEKGMSGRG